MTRSSLRPGWNRKVSIVYYLQRSDGAVKIGWTVVLPQRIKQLERTEGRLDLLIWEPGDRNLEQCRHREFAAARIDYRYEWFRLTPDLTAHIRQIQDELDEAEALFGAELAEALGVDYKPKDGGS
jgi:hypothetical protein